MKFAKKKIDKLITSLNIDLSEKNSFGFQINDQRFFTAVLFKGTLGLGESYMDKYWDCQKIDDFFHFILAAGAENDLKKIAFWQLFNPQMVGIFLTSYAHHILPKFSKLWAFKVGSKHYDAGNELFAAMLDKRMVYTCGYWRHAITLDEAQEAKFNLVCRKIGLKKGDKILDIGCGWGSFAKFAAEKYEARVVGITVSQEQVELARDMCQGLPVEIRLQDYRDVDEKFDHIVSLGMFEHVLPDSYRTYMKVVEKNLKPNGLFLLHTIGIAKTAWYGEPWLTTYIFPNSKLPSPAQITKSIEGLFVFRDWHEFGSDYDKTLMAWHKNFEQHWQELKGKYDDRFYRMWNYYLLCCAGAFRSGRNQLWQIVLSREVENISYKSIR